MIKTNKQILHLSMTSIIGGGSEYLFSLLKGFCSFDHQYSFHVACPRDGIYFDKMLNLGFGVTDLPIRSLSFKNLLSVIKLCKKLNVCLIHAHGKGAGVYARIAGFVLGIPVVYTFHGFHFEHYSRPFRIIYLLYEKFMEPLTSAYMLVSHGEKEKVLQNRIVQDHKKIYVVYNAIDPDRIHSAKKAGLNFSILDNEVAIVTLSRISQQKGIHCLLDAARIVVAKLPNVKFFVVGDSTEDESAYKGEISYRSEIYEKINKFGMEFNFIVMPKSPEALSYVYSSDIYVSASRGEGFSLSLIEAMLLGRPIVATDVVGNNEAITDRVTGILVPPENPDALAEAVIELISDHCLANSLACRAKECAEKQFSFSSMIEQTNALYNEVLSWKI